MPSSPPSVRPVLAALLTVLLLTSTALVSAPSSLFPAARAESVARAPQAPAAPPPTAEDAPVSMDLVSLTPTSLAPGGTLTAQIEVTNTTSQPLPALTLELSTRTARVTDRGDLSEWQADTSAQPRSAAVAASAPHEELAPGASVVLTVEVAAEELGYSAAPYFWGTRRLALTVASEEEPLSTLRTFVVWRPSDATDTITQSVLLPMAADDPSAMVTDPAGFAESAESGRLASVGALAHREDTDWWLDPALLDPPMMPVSPDAEATPTPTPTSEEETTAVPLEYDPEPHSAEIAATLTEGAGQRTVLSMPYARADLVSLRAAGTAQLREEVRGHGEAAWQEAGITPQGMALRVDGTIASADTLDAVREAGASTAIVPSSSLRPDPASSVTPSSVGVYAADGEDGSELALLAPDPELSTEFALLTGDTDTEQVRQRLLAETATIASEYTTAPRHLLISPSAEAVLDPAAAGAALDAMSEAPWIVPGSTDALLEAAEAQEWTTDPRSESGELYTLGRLGADEIRPSGPPDTGTGRWRHLDEVADPRLLSAGALTELQDALGRIDVLAAAMQDDAPLDAPRREILAGTSVRWRGQPDIPAARAQDASDIATGLRERIEVVPASGYNVISDAVSVPITVSNRLDTPITVRIEVTSDKPLVQVGEPAVVEVPARGQVDASVDVEAIANGSVTLTTVATTPEGQPLTEPVSVPLTVNPSWENWTTLVLVIAMGLLVVVGVARARRTGSSHRAPGVRGPEDPEELARTGRSTPDTAPTEEEDRA